MSTELVLDCLEHVVWARTRRRQRPPWAGAPHRRRSQYTSFAFTSRLIEAGVDPSVGSVGDAHALAESQIGAYKTELIRPEGPWRDVEHVELETLRRVHWFNHERPHESVDDLTPIEVETARTTLHEIVSTRPGEDTERSVWKLWGGSACRGERTEGTVGPAARVRQADRPPRRLSDGASGRQGRRDPATCEPGLATHAAITNASTPASRSATGRSSPDTPTRASPSTTTAPAATRSPRRPLPHRQ
jgi:hypothetical protein